MTERRENPELPQPSDERPRASRRDLFRIVTRAPIAALRPLGVPKVPIPTTFGRPSLQESKAIIEAILRNPPK